MIPDKIPADNTVENDPVAPPIKNMVIIAIMVGKRPLQGTKLLVIIAIRRSLGESMIRQPTIPAALQPKPMHMLEIIYAFFAAWRRCSVTDPNGLKLFIFLMGILPGLKDINPVNELVQQIQRGNLFICYFIQ